MTHPIDTTMSAGRRKANPLGGVTESSSIPVEAPSDHIVIELTDLLQRDREVPMISVVVDVPEDVARLLQRLIKPDLI